MDVNVNKLDNATVEMTVIIPAEKIDAQYDNVFNRIQKNAKLDGFRKGKAPVSMVKSVYKNEAEKQVVEDIIRDSYYDALKAKELYPINNPSFDFDKIEAGKEFSFKAKFEVRPTVELGEYKNISVEEKGCKITDKDVSAEIENIRERSANITEKEAGSKVEKGDLVKLSVEQLTSDGEPTALKPYELSVVAGQRKDDHEFDKYVVGMNVDEVKEVSFKYPKDHYAKDLAGKKVSYKVKITQINQRLLPELDDEFAKDQGFESLADMKTKINENLVKYTEEKSKGDAKSKILEKILENSKYDIPNSLIEQEKMAIFQRMQQRMGVQVPEIEKFAKTFGMEPDEFVGKMREEAVQSIKSTLTLAEISKIEEIKVTDEKFEKALEDMAMRSQKTVEEIKELVEKNKAKSNIESELLFDCAIDYLYENAKIKKLSPASFKDFVNAK